MIYFQYHWNEEQIKSEFRRLSLKYHKDTGGSDEIFRQVKQEYEDMLAIKRRWNELQTIFKRPIVKKVVKVIRQREQSFNPNDIERLINKGSETVQNISMMLNGLGTLMDKFSFDNDEDETGM